ncbi:Uncharacterised protein [Candidatus Venteria ishoeyi]|uniref:Uncharacterized protein n=1 Tax=Candidatus Venteria ishoeyi TaxID=1899563 RepID=A0A1H6F2G4_9GAMM|nr:Uncharacterised protein [Candidatus Venteria ishoeyi]
MKNSVSVGMDYSPFAKAISDPVLLTRIISQAVLGLPNRSAILFLFLRLGN